MDQATMKNSALLNQPPIQLALAAVLVIGFVYFLLRKSISDTADAIGNVNKGTPFEGFGPVGTVGNITNRISGGTLAAAGERIARYFFPVSDPTESLFYVALFPDGEKHAIASRDVDRNGFFTRAGVRYRLAQAESGKRLAVKV